MTHTPPILSLSAASFELFLSLLPKDRISWAVGQVTIHADIGDAIWFARGDRWVTAAPGLDTVKRFGSKGLPN